MFFSAIKCQILSIYFSILLKKTSQHQSFQQFRPIQILISPLMNWTDWNKILDCKNKRPRVLILIMLLDNLNEFSNDLFGKKNNPEFAGMGLGQG